MLALLWASDTNYSSPSLKPLIFPAVLWNWCTLGEILLRNYQMKNVLFSAVSYIHNKQTQSTNIIYLILVLYHRRKNQITFVYSRRLFLPFVSLSHRKWNRIINWCFFHVPTLAFDFSPETLCLIAICCDINCKDFQAALGNEKVWPKLCQASDKWGFYVFLGELILIFL